MEEKQKRRADRAERKRLAIENGETPPDEPDTPDEEDNGPKDFKEAYKQIEAEKGETEEKKE